MGNCVTNIAFEDMRKYNKENNISVFKYVDGKVDVVIPTEKYVRTKESIRLNRELGIRGLNYSESNKRRYKDEK
jgi:hypothetical protein